MARLAIVHIRNKGCFITEAHGENTDASKLAARLHGGHAIFSDSLWGRKRELVVNLADVSAIQLIEEPQDAEQGQVAPE